MLGEARVSQRKKKKSRLKKIRLVCTYRFIIGSPRYWDKHISIRGRNKGYLF